METFRRFDDVLLDRARECVEGLDDVPPYTGGETDLDAAAMRRAADSGIPLVDFEDAHGRLPHDDQKEVSMGGQPDKGATVTCTFEDDQGVQCINQAPKYGRYAGKCQEHRNGLPAFIDGRTEVEAIETAAEPEPGEYGYEEPERELPMAPKLADRPTDLHNDTLRYADMVNHAQQKVYDAQAELRDAIEAMRHHLDTVLDGTGVTE